MPTGRTTHLTEPGPAPQDGRGPFGRCKQSGIGHYLGYDAVNQFQAYHSIFGPAGRLV